MKRNTTRVGTIIAPSLKTLLMLIKGKESIPVYQYIHSQRQKNKEEERDNSHEGAREVGY